MSHLPSSQQNRTSDPNESGNTGPKKQSFANLRIMKGNSIAYILLINLKIFSYLDFKEFDSLPSTCEVTQPDLNDLSHLTVTISPDEVNLEKNKLFEIFFTFLKII